MYISPMPVLLFAFEHSRIAYVRYGSQNRRFKRHTRNVMQAQVSECRCALTHTHPHTHTHTHTHTHLFAFSHTQTLAPISEIPHVVSRVRFPLTQANIYCDCLAGRRAVTLIDLDL